MSAPDLRGERGFTLIELLVSTLAGIVVAAATGAIVVTSVHFSSNFSDRVDANQQARTAMEKITTALNSSCVATALPPLVTGGTINGAQSDDTHLYFYSSASSVSPDGPTINPSLIEVSLSGGQLILSTSPWVSGTAPTVSNPNPWAFSTTTPPNTAAVLLSHATQATIGGVAQPVFHYYGYAAGGAISTTPFTANSTTPLATADAANTAMVTISFAAVPSDNYNAGNRAANITDSVVLRLTPASSGGIASNTPCT
jgi:type II secretory pathway pseudopilin PulG